MFAPCVSERKTMNYKLSSCGVFTDYNRAVTLLSQQLSKFCGNVSVQRNQQQFHARRGAGVTHLIVELNRNLLCMTHIMP